MLRDRSLKLWDPAATAVRMNHQSPSKLNQVTLLGFFLLPPMAARARVKCSRTLAPTDSILVVNGRGQPDLTSIWFESRCCLVWNSWYRGCVGVWIWWLKVSSVQKMYDYSPTYLPNRKCQTLGGSSVVFQRWRSQVSASRYSRVVWRYGTVRFFFLLCIDPNSFAWGLWDQFKSFPIALQI